MAQTKVRKTITMDKGVAAILDANCTRHGDVTYHVENALRQYFTKPADVEKPAPRPKAVDCSSADKVIDYLNLKAGTKYKKTKSSRDPISARLADFTVEDCFVVINKKCAEWLNTSMAKYLRPATLFQASKFESYLNQLEGNDNEAGRPKSLADRSADQGAQIQSMLEAGKFDQPPMGSYGGAVPSQVDQGRGGANAGQCIDAEFYLVVQEDGGPNQ